MVAVKLHQDFPVDGLRLRSGMTGKVMSVDQSGSANIRFEAMTHDVEVGAENFDRFEITTGLFEHKKAAAETVLADLLDKQQHRETQGSKASKMLAKVQKNTDHWTT